MKAAAVSLLCLHPQPPRRAYHSPPPPPLSRNFNFHPMIRTGGPRRPHTPLIPCERHRGPAGQSEHASTSGHPGGSILIRSHPKKERRRGRWGERKVKYGCGAAACAPSLASGRGGEGRGGVRRPSGLGSLRQHGAPKCRECRRKGSMARQGPSKNNFAREPCEGLLAILVLFAKRVKRQSARSSYKFK